MKLSLVRLTNVNQFQSLRNAIRTSIADTPNYVNAMKSKVNTEKVYGKIKDINSWYTRVLGLDEVKAYQDKVIAIQEQLLKVQEDRREVGKELAGIRQKSNELQDEIHRIKRNENLQKFLELMKEETEILKMEAAVSQIFQQHDQAERELFTAFINSIKDSHEKQRAQLEYTKYFGFILSIAGSFLAFCYSTLRKHDLKNFIEKKMSAIDSSSKPFTQYQLANEKYLKTILKNQESLFANLQQIDSRAQSYKFQNVPSKMYVEQDGYEVDLGVVLKYVGYACATLLVLSFFSR